MAEKRSAPEGATQNALLACARWLSGCIRIGWPKDELDALEALWWEWHDAKGKPKPVPPAIPERRAIAAWVQRVADEWHAHGPPFDPFDRIIAGILSGEPVAAAARGELDEVLGRLP